MHKGVFLISISGRGNWVFAAPHGDIVHIVHDQLPELSEYSLHITCQAIADNH
jgi:hypothetical protein